MTRRSIILGLLALLAVSSRLAAQAGDVTQFVPLVAAGDTVARCERMSTLVLQPDERGFVLRYPARRDSGRVVSAVWDTSGHLRQYTDARGDLRGPPVPLGERGPRTTIAIDMTHGRALLVNEDHGRQ